MADINLTLGVDVSDAESQLNGFNRTVQSAFNSSNSSVNKMGVSLSKVVQDIQRTTSRMREISTIRIENPQLQSTDSAIQQINTDLDRARVAQQRLFITGQTNTQAYTDATLQVQGLEMELQRAVTYRDQLMSQPVQVVDNTQSEEYRAMSDHLTNCVNQANILTHGINQSVGATSKFGKAVSVLKTLWGRVTSALSKFRGVLGKTGNSHNMTFKKMLTSVMKYVFGIRSIFLAYKKMRTVIKEGLKSMAKQFPEIATQVNALNNAWWGFKSSIVSAFQPIFSYVVPALVTLINYLTSAMNTLANFFAVLTGQGYYYKAVKGNKDVAKAVGGTGSAAKKSNEELAEYDKLLVIDQKDSGGGGGGGGAGSDDDGFNWVKEQTETNDFIESLKKAWAEGDYEGLGRIISQKLTDMMNNIPWDSIYAKAKDFGTNLASFLNGLINPELFTALGTTIANALKTALIFLQSFGDTFDWANLGNSISAGINAFFENFQFSQLAQTFNTWANGILTTLITAVQGIKWGDIAQNIADGIGALDTKGIMWNVGTLVTSLAQAIIDFAGNNDLWANLGTKIAEGINGFLKGFDIGKSLTALGTVAAGIINTLATFIQKVDWDQVGATLIQGLTGIFTNIPWDKIVGGVSSLLFASLKAIFNLKMGMDQEIVDNLVEFFKGIGLDGVAGFLEGLSEAIGKAKEFINGVFDSVIQWVKEFFGIASPSKVFAEIGGFLIEGLKQGLLNAVSAIGTWIKENVVDKITGAMDAVKEIFVTAKGVVDNTFTNLQQAWDAFKDKLATLTGEAKEKVAGAISALKAGWDSVVDKTATLIGEAKDNAKNIFETLKGYWNGIADKTAKLTGDAVDKAKSVVSTLSGYWNSIVDKTAKLTGSAVDNAKSTVSTLAGYWSSITNVTRTLTGSAVDNAKNVAVTLKDYWAPIKSKTATLTGEAVNGASSVFNTLKDCWQTIKNKTAELTGKADNKNEKTLSSLKNSWTTIVTKTSTLTAKAVNKSSKVLNALTNAWNSIKTKTVTLTANIKEGASGVKGALAKLFGFKKAKGGVLSHGTWKAIPQYASGTLNAGSLFVAGEAGPEIVGNVKGRTEVLNASQIASAIRTAVIDGMTAVLNKIQGLNLNLNLSALSNIPPIPVIVTGQLLPLTEAFMFKFEEQHKDFEDVKLRLDDIIRRLSDGSNKEPIMLQLDGRTIVQLVWDETQKRYKQTGKPMFA